MDVLDGDVENMYGRPGDRITVSYFSRLRSIRKSLAAPRRAVRIGVA